MQNRTELRGSFLVLSKGKAIQFVRTRGFSKLTRFRRTENLVNPFVWTWTWLNTSNQNITTRKSQLDKPQRPFREGRHHYPCVDIATPEPQTSGKRCPLTGAKMPKIGKNEGFRSQKNPHFPPPQKRALRVKKSHFPCRALYRNGDFLTRSALFWGGGKWGFFDFETLFSRFWGFWPL